MSILFGLLCWFGSSISDNDCIIDWEHCVSDWLCINETKTLILIQKSKNSLHGHYSTKFTVNCFKRTPSDTDRDHTVYDQPAELLTK